MHTPLFCYYAYIHVYTYLNMLSYINALFQFSVFSRFVKNLVLSLSIKIVLTLFVSYGSSAVTRHRSWKITSKKIRTSLPNPFDTLNFYDLVTQKSSASVDMVLIQFVWCIVLLIISSLKPERCHSAKFVVTHGFVYFHDEKISTKKWIFKIQMNVTHTVHYFTFYHFGHQVLVKKISQLSVSILRTYLLISLGITDLMVNDFIV